VCVVCVCVCVCVVDDDNYCSLDYSTPEEEDSNLNCELIPNE
jgi:hypothetical protein